MFEGLITAGLVLGIGIIGAACHYSLAAGVLVLGLAWLVVMYLPEGWSP